MQVIKRDGRVVDFNPERIVKAITLAMSQTPGGVDIDLANKIALSVQKQFEDKMQTTVYEIQDAVEKKLMASSRKEVAQSYITYRYNRDVARKSKTKEIFLDIISAKANETEKENNNKNDDTPSAMMMKFATETTKPFVSDFLLSREARDAEKNGYIYVHDKNYYPTKSLSCVQHPLDKILKKGLKAEYGATRPAKRIETAGILASISLEIVQNEMHGGQSIPAFDYYMAPYVKLTFIEEIKKMAELLGQDLSNLISYQPKEYIKKDLENLKGEERTLQAAINNTVYRVKQSMEGFIHDMNTIPSRSGNKIVFSSINYGTDTSPEGRCIIREVLLSTQSGVGDGQTPHFPIQIWKKKKGVNYLPEDKNYDLYKLACEVASQRLIPNFSNLDASFNQNEKWQAVDPKRYEYECAIMGGRTRVFENRNGEKTSIGRGALSYTTINLPRLAIESAYEAQEKTGVQFELGRGSEKYMTNTYQKTVQKIFMQKLEHYTEIVAKQLYDRYCFQSSAIAKQFPLLMSGIWAESDNLKPFEKVEPALKQGTLNIGFIGLAECLITITGTHHGETENSQKLGIEIVNSMLEIAEEFSDKYNLNYTVFATAEENLSPKFIRKDKNEFGIIPGVTDKNNYTNGSQIQQNFECTVEKKAKIEAPFHKLCRGGNVFFVKLEKEDIKKPENIQKIVDLMDKYEIGYIQINTSKAKCLSCEYENENSNLEICPNCGSIEIEHIVANKIY